MNTYLLSTLQKKSLPQLHIPVNASEISLTFSTKHFVSFCKNIPLILLKRTLIIKTSYTSLISFHIVLWKIFYIVVEAQIFYWYLIRGEYFLNITVNEIKITTISCFQNALTRSVKKTSIKNLLEKSLIIQRNVYNVLNEG